MTIELRALRVEMHKISHDARKICEVRDRLAARTPRFRKPSGLIAELQALEAGRSAIVLEQIEAARAVRP